MRTAWGFLKQSYDEWSEDKAPRLGAALAYYTSLSLAPLLLIIIAIAGLAFGEQAARGQIIDQVQGLIGPQAGKALQDMLANAQKPSSGIVATIVGVVTLVLGASGVFGQLQDALNTIWEVAPRPGRGLRGLVKDRFLSLTMVLGTGFLLLVSLVLTTAVAAAGGTLKSLGPGMEAGAHVVVFLVSFAVVTLLFALIFKFLPDARIAWRDVWMGAIATAILFVIGKFAIGFYLGHAGVASAYGAAGSFVVILVWVYYSAQILLFGAEMTKVWANRFGSKLQPARGAVRITARERAEQGMKRPA